jgi:hypothetical protein
MDIRHSADELGEDPLDFVDGESAMLYQVVVQFVTGTVFQDQPDQCFCHYDLVETGDMWMYKLSVMVDFACEIRVALFRGLEHDLGPIGEFMCCQVDLPKRSFPYQTAECVVANGLEILVGEFAARKSKSVN